MKIQAAKLLLLFLIWPLQALGALQTPWTLSYGDGSANAYHFKQDSKSSDVFFEYVPVRPEQSSTGFYSGGVPRKGLLDPKRVSELEKWLDKLESDPSLRSDSRDKGTGAFTIKTGNPVLYHQGWPGFAGV
jgi:hypothetical protein